MANNNEDAPNGADEQSTQQSGLAGGVSRRFSLKLAGAGIGLASIPPVSGDSIDRISVKKTDPLRRMALHGCARSMV